MVKPLPPFEPLSDADLRAAWRAFPDPVVQRIVLDLVRTCRALAKIDGLYKVIHKAWRESVGGDLVALHLMQKIMNQERGRLDQSV